jgi:NAD+ synthase
MSAMAVPLDDTGKPLFELPDELAIDTGVARRVISGFIRGQLSQAGFERCVLGLSGGIDSALVAYLVAEAVGPDNLLCVMLPYRTSSPASRGDAETVIAALGCRSDLVEITAMVDGYFGSDGANGAGGAGGAGGPAVVGASALRRGNFMARMRMSVLYDRSAEFGGLVVGTGNKTESLIGYTTMYGDNACAFNPIGDLYKSQVRQLAADIGVPRAIISKAPSADLWPNQTDEGEGSFSYPLLDRILYWRIDRRRSTDELIGMGFDAALVARVERLVATSEFKRQTPPIAKLGPRTAGVDYLYPRRRPGSARTESGGGVGRHPLRGGDADRQPRRHHAPGARGTPGRAADRRRGHADGVPAPRPVRDRDAHDLVPRAERGGTARGVVGPPAGWRGPRRHHGRGYAGGERPGRGPRGCLGGDGRVRRSDPGRLLGARRGLRERNRGATLGLRGLPAEVRPGAEGTSRADCRGRTRKHPVRGAGPAGSNAPRSGHRVRFAARSRGVSRAHEAARADQPRAALRAGSSG